jgi:hypothetical protein
MKRKTPLAACALVALLLPTSVHAQSRSSRERDLREWEVKAEKMRQHLLPTMREHGVDMWIIMSRENNPDPALELFGGYGISGWYGHRNAYVFYDAGDEGLETAAIGTHLSGHLSRFYDHVMSYHASDEGLSPTLRAFVHDRDPQVIAINQSRTISMADGISAELKDYLFEAIGPEYASRVVTSEPMFIDYVSERTPAELAIAKEAAYRTWHILRRAFSSEVITPGQTTLMDVYWWVKDEWMAQDLEFNFPASFDLWRQGREEPFTDVDDPVILPGDLLHVDFGVRLSGLVTDQQKMAYVLKPGEAAPPEGLRHLFEQSIRQGEIIAETIKPGVLGRDIVTVAEERGQSEGIDNRTYPHVQGNWVHGVGAWGSRDWPERYGIHPREPVRPTEFWSIEFSVSGPVPEWEGQRVTMAREEDAWVDQNGQVHFMVGPQMELWLIGQPAVIY